MRSLHTLWSLVCAKGGSWGRVVPGKKCRDQQSPLGASQKEVKGRQNPGGDRGRRPTEKGSLDRQQKQQTTPCVRSRPARQGVDNACTENHFLPLRKSSLYKVQEIKQKGRVYVEWGRGGWRAGKERCQRPIPARFTSAQTQESSGWQNPDKQHFINPFPTT